MYVDSAHVHRDVSYCLQLLAKILPKSQLEVVKHPTSGGSELNNMILQGVLKIPKSVLFFSPKFPSAEYTMSQKYKGNMMLPLWSHIQKKLLRMLF